VLANGGDAISEVTVPERLRADLEGVGFSEGRLQGSNIALCLSLAVSAPRGIACEDEAFRRIAQAAYSIRDAALRVGLDLPVVVVLELPLVKQAAVPPEDYEEFRTVSNKWAGDQDWHHGDFALYLCPPIDPGSPAWADWQGPRSGEEMVTHLLGHGPDDWGLTPTERRTELGVAEQLEAWAEEHGLDRSDPYGDLILSAAIAFRDLHHALSENRSDEARSDAEPEAMGAIDAWVPRQLKAAGSPSAPEG
jgi:hypothetical protein